ncbi:transposase [Mycoplasma sp. 125]|uniref:transposase n=1 Tax=Mycoplasma sp. 125 TaxID=3447505 RepID=UPI003F65E6F4
MLSAKELYDKYKLATQEEVCEIIKQNTKDLIQTMLEEEMKKHLGYDRYEHGKAIKDNYRNGSYSKNLRLNLGEI